MCIKFGPRPAIVLLIALFVTACAAERTGANATADDLYQKTMQAQILLDTYYGERTHLMDAAQLIREVLEIDDQFAPAYVQLSRVVLMGGHIVSREFQGGTLESARAALEQAIESDPQYPESYVLMGHVETLFGQLDAGRESLLKAIQLGSSNPWIGYNLGRIEVKASALAEGDEYFEQTVRLGVGETAQQRRAYVAALNEQANIAYQQSDTERLVQLALKATEATLARDAWTWGNTGGLLCRAGRLDLGIEHNRKALSIMSYGVGRYNLAYCLYGKWAEMVFNGQASQAGRYFDEAYQMLPDIGRVADDFRRTDIAHLRKFLLQKADETETNT